MPEINAEANAYFIASHLLQNIEQKGKISSGVWQEGDGTGVGRNTAGVALKERLDPMSPIPGEPEGGGTIVSLGSRSRGFAMESELL